MPIDPTIALSGVAPKITDPMEAYGRALSLRNLTQQGELGAEQIQAAKLHNQQTQTDIDDQATMKRLYADAGGDLNKMQQLMPGKVSSKAMMAFNQAVLTHREGLAKLSKEELANQETRSQAIAGGLQAVLGKPELYSQMRADLISKGFAKPEELPETYAGEDWMRMHINGANTSIQQLEQVRKDQEAQRSQTNFEAELPGKKAESETKVITGQQMKDLGMTQQQADTLAGSADAREETQRHNSAMEKFTASGQQQSAAAQKEVARHNKALEAHQAAMTEGVSLTPESRDKMATMFATTGQLPQLGMGQAVARMRSEIINRASEMYPNIDFASNAAAFAANKESLKKVTGQLDAVSSFEGTAKKNLKLFTDAAEKLVDTGVPWFNIPVRLVTEKIAGSENMAVVNATRQIGLTEIAKVANNPSLVGTLSDSARHEVLGLSPKDATIGQILAVAKVLQQDMTNRHESLTEQRDAIANRIGINKAAAAPGTEASSEQKAPASSGAVKVTDPNGGVHTFADQAAADRFKKLAGIK